ncbi:hypothetical protein ANN_14685 [Periplaneta americana]|uniref:Uncharacterized protein n=1 Tax=Periplaneta americana TaxID=6978 RepID=A0ABQ8SWX7_PERAM|nr:hypothetical protein ANN_14685 [Periplaneta americana]
MITSPNPNEYVYVWDLNVLCSHGQGMIAAHGQTDAYFEVLATVKGKYAELGLDFEPEEAFVYFELVFMLQFVEFGHRKWLKHTFGLMFLFPHEVESCFTEDLMSDKPVDEQIDAYSDYLLEICITPEALFPPEIWTCHSASNELTTNACESFHASYNKSFYQEHPNLPIGNDDYDSYGVHENDDGDYGGYRADDDNSDYVDNGDDRYGTDNDDMTMIMMVMKYNDDDVDDYDDDEDDDDDYGGYETDYDYDDGDNDYSSGVNNDDDYGHDGYGVGDDHGGGGGGSGGGVLIMVIK